MLKKSSLLILSIISGLFLLTSCGGSGGGGGGGDTTPPPAADTSVKYITSFKFLYADNSSDVSSDISGIVDGKYVSVTLPEGTDVSSLIPTIEYDGNSISPASKVAQDYSVSPFKYYINKNDDPSTDCFVVTEIVGSPRSITLFKFMDASNDDLNVDVNSKIDHTFIYAHVPNDASIDNLTPVLEFEGTSIDKVSGAAQNFTDGVEYIVTATNGMTKSYMIYAKRDVTITWDRNREKSVNSTGGGYSLYYHTSPDFDIGNGDVKSVLLPYTSGEWAPNSTQLKLGYESSGTYYFKIKTYSSSHNIISNERSVSIPAY